MGYAFLFTFLFRTELSHSCSHHFPQIPLHLWHSFPSIVVKILAFSFLHFQGSFWYLKIKIMSHVATPSPRIPLFFTFCFKDLGLGVRFLAPRSLFFPLQHHLHRACLPCTPEPGAQRRDRWVPGVPALPAASGTRRLRYTSRQLGLSEHSPQGLLPVG